jgi:OOP family OmpA-OmpF porin
VLGIDWAEIRVDGLRVVVSGHAPDLAAHDLALQSARATAHFARIDDHMTASLAPPQQQDPILVEILRDDGGMTLTGRFYGEKMRRRFLDAIAAKAPDLILHDLTGVNAARPAAGWGPELAVAAEAAVRVPNAYVRVEPGTVSVEGLAQDEDHRAALTSDLLERAGIGVQLRLALRKPLVVAVPFSFAIIKDQAGGMRLEQCAARDASEAAAVEALLTRAGLESGSGRCPEALGGPTGNWPGAIAAGLEALAVLPAGRFRLEYHAAELTGLPPTGRAELEQALVALVAGLPQGYGLIGELAANDTGAAATAARERAWLRFSRRDGSVFLGGQLSKGPARRIIETHAAARFGREATRSELSDGAPAVPPGWEVAAMVALDALAGVPEGTVEVTQGSLVLTASLTDPGQARSLHRILEGEIPKDYRVSTRLTVDLPSQVASQPLTSARCAVLLNEQVTGVPIEFDPGSAVIGAASRETVDDLARILQRCGEGRIEIAGHTDSQGSEELNQRLSQARAEAVLDAMLARRVRLERMSARGYGEELPLASNATEEGRARNRRIEFTAIE